MISFCRAGRFTTYKRMPLNILYVYVFAGDLRTLYIRSVFRISCLFLRPRLSQFEIGDSTDKWATYLLLGFETLDLKFCDLKLWKLTVSVFLLEDYFGFVWVIIFGGLFWIIFLEDYLYPYLQAGYIIILSLSRAGAVLRRRLGVAEERGLQRAARLKAYVCIHIYVYIYIYVCMYRYV